MDSKKKSKKDNKEEDKKAGDKFDEEVPGPA